LLGDNSSNEYERLAATSRGIVPELSKPPFREGESVCWINGGQQHSGQDPPS
jgi:hypothetical protein